MKDRYYKVPADVRRYTEICDSRPYQIDGEEMCIRDRAGVDRLLVDIRVLLYLNRSVIGRGDTGMCSAFIIYRRADSRNAAEINFL